MNLYIIRHGQTEWNITHKLQGKADIQLNDKGIEQAKQAKNIFNNLDIDLIICSTLDRAKETAKIINEDKNIPIIYDERIRERNYGILEGCSTREIDIKRLMNYYINEKVEKGESSKQFFKRIYDFLNELESNYNNNEKILLVTHGGVSKAVECYFNGIPEDGDIEKQKMMGNCEIKEYSK